MSSSRAPVRALLETGVDPAEPIAMRHPGSAAIAMRSTVGEAAKWTVREDPRAAFVRYVEHPAQKASWLYTGRPKQGHLALGRWWTPG
jgi:hypothetical protein